MKALLIDDDINLGKVISFQLEQEGFEVTRATSGSAGLELFKRDNFDIVISDIQMPGMNGIEMLKKIREINGDAVVIMITAYGSVDSALEACRLGADDYISKPFGKEQLIFTVNKALKMRELQRENRELKEELSEKFSIDRFISAGDTMEQVLKKVRKLAASETTVLIRGESGTGKELIAKAIHYNSDRKDKPLVVVNCPSIPDNLLESELFGHVKGAFTGALTNHDGKFLLADGGTIFLDEIGDLHPELQAKLLRFLQEREFEPIGSNRTVKVDVRIIAATHRDLAEMVEKGEFREDLFYRLSVVPLFIPPLRERKEDIPYLTDFFLRRYGSEKGYFFNKEALSALTAYDWPGNVRELENVVEGAIALADGLELGVENIPGHIRSLAADKTSQSYNGEVSGLKELEKKAIESALAETGGNKAKAARLLKIPRHVLLYRLKKYGL